MKDQVSESWDEIVFDENGMTREYVVTMETDEGNVVIEFFPEEAPNHVRSFLALSRAGFFDDLIFHRTIPGFVIQGGCPLGTGTGGPGYCLKPEFNAIPHERGVLSMARAQPTDSAGSQFFVCVDRTASLDNKYTVFGKVVDGMDVVDRIVARPTGPGDRPLNPVKIKSVKVATKQANAAELDK